MFVKMEISDVGLYFYVHVLLFTVYCRCLLIYSNDNQVKMKALEQWLLIN